jgi:glycosyltransferase involved in cell wall biosynthesis
VNVRLLVVVQRYGPNVIGGSESASREFATRLVALGNEVAVLTSCAESYADWANVFPAGDDLLDGVTVHRLPVAHVRDGRFHSPLLTRVALARHRSGPLYVQREWMRAQGPYMTGLVPWLESRAGSFDVVVFFTYLYFTTWAGMAAAAGRAPIVFHPTAHDEPPLHLSLFDATFRLPSGFGFLTPEEEALVVRRFRVNRPSIVTGLGVDLERDGADDRDFRERFRLGDRPYIICVGRIDRNKGTYELLDFFTTYKRRNPGPVKLVVVGPAPATMNPHPDVVFTDTVDERDKWSAISGAHALVQPSYRESFSIVLAEAWAQRTPALVNGYCEVLEGQARRSGGALPYRGYAEFEAALEWLLADASLRASLGDAGRRYAERSFRWDAIMDRYVDFLAWVSERPPRPMTVPGAGATR